MTGMDKWIAKVEQMSVLQKTLALLLVLLVLVGAGVGKWVYDMRAEAAAQKEAASASASPAPSAEPVSPIEGETTAPAEETPEPTEEAPGVSQKDSAKDALTTLVPVWASLDYAKTGTDSAKWQTTWRDMPEAGPSLVTQSRNNFVGLFRGVITLNANAKVDTLKHVELVWQEGNLSGWTVEMDRNLTSADGSGVLDETESVMWEFTVEQQGDGSSQVTGYSAAADDHDH